MKQSSLLLMLSLTACDWDWPRSENEIQVLRHHLAVGQTVESNTVPVEEFQRSQKPMAVYFVTLTEVPKWRRLDLDCQWRDPRGTVVHENHYETERIGRSPWTTHCRNQLGLDSPPGRWTVTMSSGERLLCSKVFEVR